VTNTQEKLCCTPAIWIRTVLAVAAEYGVEPGLVLAGERAGKPAGVRWEAWRRLVARNFSYSSIGRTSGFDHTTVRHATRADVRDKQLGPINLYRQKTPLQRLEVA
jgi:hypothetical protein